MPLSLTNAPTISAFICRVLCRVRGESLVRNSMYMMATTVVTSLLGYVYWIVAARRYSAHDVGLAAALIAAMTVTAILANCGISSMLVQVLPTRAPGREWSTTLTAGLALGLAGGLVASVVVAIVLPLFSRQFVALGHTAAYIVIVAFIASVPLWVVSTLLDSTFIAQRAAGYMLVRNTAFSLLKIPLLVALPLLGGSGPMGIFASWVLAAAVGVVGGLLLIARLGQRYRLVTRGMVAQARAMLSSLAGHHFINLGSIAPVYVLPMMVTARLSPADNAYYYTTWMLGGLFFMVSPSVASSLFAEGSHAAGDILHKARSSAGIIAALLVPVMLLFLLGGRTIMAVFGPAYPRHGLFLLTLLTVSAVPDAVTNIYVSVLRVQRRLRLAACLNLGMAALTLALAWVLLPSCGIAGAGWAWLCAQTAGSVVVAGRLAVTHGRLNSAGFAGPGGRAPTAVIAPVDQGD